VEVHFITRPEETAGRRSRASTANLLADNLTSTRLPEPEVLETVAAIRSSTSGAATQARWTGC